MSIIRALFARLLDGVDALFDASAAILRVLLRGVFAPDARSYRGGRFAPVSADAILVQDIALNAGDITQARKAVALDPERHLPLSLDAAAFDIAGPVDAAEKVRARPERRFVIGLVRAEALVSLRDALPKARRGAIEAFTHVPPDYPSQVLVFRDAQGDRRRRTRRVLLLTAIAALLFTGAEAVRAGHAAMERAIAQADAERVNAERRVRLAERRAAAAQAALLLLETEDLPTLAATSARLQRLALHQPPQTETLIVEGHGAALRLSGRTYAPLETELALRRAFESQTLAFSADEEMPASFTAELGARAQEAQR